MSTAYTSAPHSAANRAVSLSPHPTSITLSFGPIGKPGNSSHDLRLCHPNCSPSLTEVVFGRSGRRDRRTLLNRFWNNALLQAHRASPYGPLTKWIQRRMDESVPTSEIDASVYRQNDGKESRLVARDDKI